jgi:hypothetical protein
MRVQPAAKRRFFRSIQKFTAGIVLATSLIAGTAHADPGKIDDADHYDARLQGLTPDVELPPGSNGMSWFLMLAFAFVCMSVIFKDAKRSHLD